MWRDELAAQKLCLTTEVDPRIACDPAYELPSQHQRQPLHQAQACPNVAKPKFARALPKKMTCGLNFATLSVVRTAALLDAP